MQVTVDIPDEFAAQLVPAGSDPGRLVLENSVAEAYRHRRLTMEQVRQILGFATRMEVDPFLKKYEIYDYALADYERDVVTLDRFMQGETG